MHEMMMKSTFVNFKKELQIMKSASKQMLLRKFPNCYLVIDQTMISHERFMGVCYEVFVYT